MKTTDVTAEVLRFDPALPIEEAWMPPASWYLDPEFHELERRAVLQRAWQPVARLTQLQEPGSYASGRLFGLPWLVVRDEAGELRGFHNSCRHKGREVVEGCGRADELVCGYHAWRYGLDGSLRSAPRIGGIRDFDRAVMSLPPLALETWGPWVFVNFAPAPAPLRPRLGELDARLERSEWSKLTFVGERTWTLECNWKVYVDNFLDGGYHIPHMHPSLDAQIDMATYKTELFETYSIQGADPARNGDSRIDFDAEKRIGPGAIYGWLHPNFMLNRYGPCLDTNFVLPLGHERCHVVYEFWFDASDGTPDPAFVEESMTQSAVTQQEDIAICESVQRGLASPSYDRGRYAPQVEIGEYHFHRLLAAELRAELA